MRQYNKWNVSLFICTETMLTDLSVRRNKGGYFDRIRRDQKEPEDVHPEFDWEIQDPERGFHHLSRFISARAWTSAA